MGMHRGSDNNGTLDTTYYYLHDDLYNVVGVTDATGTLVELYEYGEYGKPTIYQVPASGPEIALGDVSAIGNRYLFNGREYDSATGLYWYRTRYMDPEQGRFIARDTIGAWGDANNLGNPFAYVGNNPWSRLDPYGRSAGVGMAYFGTQPGGRPVFETPEDAIEGSKTAAIAGLNGAAWGIGGVPGVVISGITAGLMGATDYYERQAQFVESTGRELTGYEATGVVFADMTLGPF